MAEINLSKYGITGTTEIVYNPSYEELFKEDIKNRILGSVNLVNELAINRIEKARTVDAATHCRRFFLLPAPKYWAVIIEKPFVSPIEKPTIRKVSEDIFPTAAS